MISDCEASEIWRDYESWLHKVAYSLLGSNSSLHDDLVQEGFFAMIKAYETHDPEKSFLPYWLTASARNRMTSLMFCGGAPTGKPACNYNVGGDMYSFFLDSQNPDSLTDVEESETWNTACNDEYNYLHDPVQIILKKLPAHYREYIFLRFWLGLDPMIKPKNPGVLRTIYDQYPILADKCIFSNIKARLRPMMKELIDV